MSGEDIARFFDADRKTGQRFNRIFRTMTRGLQPDALPGFSEWDESVPIKYQWVLGGVSRATGQCRITSITHRDEDTLVPIVEKQTDPDGVVLTDEWGGYCGLLNRMTVNHSQGFVNRSASFIHTNTIEGVWGHLKPLGRHIYRGFPRSSLPQFLSEFMFRYNHRCYQTRVSVLSALLSRKINTVLV